MATVLYDLETCIAGKGQRRRQTIPIEIAMLDPETNEHVQCTFWPLAFPLEQSLREYGANVKGSLRCIKKVFGTIPTERGDIRTLEEAKRLVREWCSTRTVRRLVAHNGKSFDHPIYKEWFKDTSIPFDDSLQLLRRLRPNLLSHSLPILTKRVKKRVEEHMQKYAPETQAKQHRALYDCVALAEVLKHYGVEHTQATRDTQTTRDTRDTQTDTWREISGVGAKTAACVRQKWEHPEDFVKWAKKRPECEVRLALKGLGVRRIPTLLRYMSSRV